MKSRKALLKRFKITKKGKIMRRKGGQNHYRAKKSGKKIRSLRKFIEVDKSLGKIIRRLIKK